MERAVLQNGKSVPTPSPAWRLLSRARGRMRETLTEARGQCAGRARRPRQLLIEFLHRVQLLFRRATRSAALACVRGLPQVEGHEA